MLKKIGIILLLMASTNVLSEERTDGYRTITRLYLNGTDYVNFYLDQNCPNGKAYYVLRSNRVDVDRYYSTLMAAFMANKKVDVIYETNGSLCEVVRMFVE